MFLHEFQYDLRGISGLGKKGIERLSNLQITNIKELIEYFPKKYEDRQNIKTFPDPLKVKNCELMTIFTVLEHKNFGNNFRKNLKMIARSENGEIFEILLFNRGFLEGIFKIGQKFYIYSKFNYNDYNQMWSCSNFDSEVFSYNPERFKKIVPVYSLSEGLTSKKISSYIKEALVYFVKFGQSDIPEFLINKYSLLPFYEALNEIHFPSSFEMLDRARITLIYREIFLLQFFSRGKNSKVFLRGERYLSRNLLDQIILKLPFKLTKDQEVAIDEIIDDLKSSKPMNRLLQGDVGSGKTLVAFLSSIPLVEAGYQVALMVPTDLLAQQHYSNLSSILKDFNISIALLTGSLKKRDRDDVLKKLQSGIYSLVIGTHAIFAQVTKFKKLAYIIIDEQHKFGVEQREELKNKGEGVDVLLMSATPIPRSLALTLFGDLQVSLIKKGPAGRMPVTTYLAKHGNEEKVYEFLKNELAKGHQVYFVYPLISSSQKFDLKDATSMCLTLKNIFVEYSVAMIHSKLESDIKEEIMQDFYLRKIDILVATSVIEVGIDCPNATCMVVEHAERFGLSALHQIRGRVGRGSLKSFLFLLYKEPLTQAGKFRLKTIKENIDGFKIAEEDLKLRGPGNLFGLEQSGYLKLKIADFIENREIISLIRDELNMFFLNKSFYNKSDVELLDNLLLSYLRSVGKDN
ncbi:ATP-dependent DNA helicase RecG [Borrelia miyamotoi]|uniref:ATP-dependent DNA helicase RecG n=1 Tax=Borrelia miyamotoi TaxID=47466 RepID=A0AAQ3AGX2_9SPIR|nr:ATP-dependent DNA helicase RecG [Borrelia miyamotoi]AGT27531.1 ATP-dependent DNA helicase RecG [Borrelia miyamotoi LB-2001]AJA58712.1 ATP-dependent DNA helicase RecG [Borrelia miyamotoi]AOW95790.1 ATP-dependent DNA helicase RecG [Borrelia miyamotoi]QTL83678.1 ATP-dependent DNA helicase RecG [Borrelia miyamotoi]WAZ85019.1 ATP-dependent DNA helicase RecG [Borrelia miyamotoi]